MKKEAKYLEDSYIDYRLIRRFLLLVIVFIASFLVINGPVRELIIQDTGAYEVDMESYFKGVKKFTIVNDGHSLIPIRYTAFDPDGYESGSRKLTPEFTKSDDGTEVILTLDDDDRDHLSSLYIRGPSLEELKIRGPVEVSYNGHTALKVVNQGGIFNLLGTNGEDVAIINNKGATSRLDYGALENLAITLNGGRVTVGEVNTLKVQTPECTDEYARNVITVESIRSKRMLYDGRELAVQSMVSECSNLVIGMSGDE